VGHGRKKITIKGQLPGYGARGVAVGHDHDPEPERLVPVQLWHEQRRRLLFEIRNIARQKLSFQSQPSWGLHPYAKFIQTRPPEQLEIDLGVHPHETAVQHIGRGYRGKPIAPPVTLKHDTID